MGLLSITEQDSREFLSMFLNTKLFSSFITPRMHGNRFSPSDGTIDSKFESLAKSKMISVVLVYQSLLEFSLDGYMLCTVEEDEARWSNKKDNRKSPPIERKRFCSINDKKFTYYRSSKR